MQMSQNRKPRGQTETLAGAPVSPNLQRQKNSLSNEPWWYNSKESLLKDVKVSPSTYLISKDVCASAKNFAVFITGKDIVTYIKSLKTPHIHEIVYETTNYPCYLYFDLDREVDFTITDDYLETIVNKFLFIITSFIKDIYNQDINLTIGENMQVSYSKSPSKLSLHIKINIIFDHVNIMRNFIDNLDQYMCSNKYVSRDYTSEFYYHKEGIHTPIIDKTVYSNFRSFRTLTSSKLLKIDYPLIPWGNSSQNIEDHLIRVYHDIPQTTIPVQITLLHVNIDADFTSLKTPSINAKQHVSSEEEEPKNAQISQICQEEEERIRNFILSSSEIKNMLGNQDFYFEYENYFRPHILHLPIAKQCKCMCPYAGRSHQNNRSYFEYNCLNKTIKYKCFNEHCKDTQQTNCIIFHLNFEEDALLRLSNLQVKPTLHCKEDIIQWNSVYEAQTMFPYPLKPITCIRANMGACKTQCLIQDFIPKYCMHPNTKCLIITYQILLSKKYHGVLSAYGFANYLDRPANTYMINENKVIVCLDSLWRIETRNFDFIFIDEVLSVLLHFNSPLMKKVSTISTLFELLILQAKYVYLLDACVDNTMVYNFVKYIAQTKSQEPYWIRNTYIRPNNRKCLLTINKKKKTEKDFKSHVLNKICDLLTNNKRIVISSSTKRFTEIAESMIKSKFNDTKSILVYNSDTDRKIIYEHAINPNGIWKNYDVLIYSPSITAGVSFELLHFDEQVSYLENSFFTPTVDLALQQMFRVRQLITGSMHVFINQIINIDVSDYPVKDVDIENFLDRNISMLNKYFPDETLAFETNTIVTAKGVGYDKRRLSYEILKGIIGIKNKSIRYYIEIIKNTLKKDYNIECLETLFDTPTDELSKVVKMELESFNKTVPEEVTEENLSSFFIEEGEYEHLCEKECRQEILTAKERLCKHIYQMVVKVWGISHPNRIDMDFFENYIGYYNDKKVIRRSYDRYYRALRFVDFLKYSEEENKIRMQGSLSSLASEEEGKRDTNIEMYRTRMKSYYIKLMEGSALLKSVLGERLEEAKKGWKEDKNHSEKSEDLKKRMEEYVKELSNDRFVTIQRELELDKRYFESREKIKDKELAYVKTVLREVFGMEFRTEKRGTRHKERQGYGNETKKFEMSWLNNIKEKYDPKHLKIASATNGSEYLFIDTDDDNDDL